MERNSKSFSFLKTYKDLTEVLTDHKLAALGDAYINFVYSLALSERKGEPRGAKVKGRVLSEAFKKAGLREYMPSRITKHILADAAEALVVYAWLHNYTVIKESVKMLKEAETLTDGVSRLLVTIKNRIKF